MHIGKKIKEIRKSLKLTKIELSELSGISVKTIYDIEVTGRNPSKKTIAKIRNCLFKKFGLDFYNIINYKIVWWAKDLDTETLSLIEGGLLGDGSISKTGVYTQQAKDKKYLEWLAGLLFKVGIHCNVVPVNYKTGFSSSHEFWQLYSHSCPALLNIRKKWYIGQDSELSKRVPSEIKITSITLLHWYLGDGYLKRDFRLDQMTRPIVRLHTEGFVKKDIKLLIKKLDKMGLEFFSVPKLNEEKETGYTLYSNPDSVFRFFMIIGTKPIREIKDCITRFIVTRNKICKFEDKWPYKTDWVRILAQNNNIGFVIRKRRKMLGLGQRKLAKMVKTVPHHIVGIESGKKHPSARLFKILLEALQLDIDSVLNILSLLHSKPDQLALQSHAYINGAAGYLAAKKKGESLIASDVIEKIPEVIRS